MKCNTIKMLTRMSILLCFVLLYHSIATAGGASVVRATRIDGSVTVNGAALKEGDILTRDSKIEVQKGGLAMLSWSNGTMVEVYPGTTLVLRGVMFEVDRNMEKSQLALEKGRIFVKAQVPEHIFGHFEISVGYDSMMSQGAEFALKYSPKKKKFSVLSILGRVVVALDESQERVDDGQRLIVIDGEATTEPELMPQKIKSALDKTSDRLGGSLLKEEELSPPGGPLELKIGGVRNRRGDAPYVVNFKALVGGGSGKIKSYRWEFGDGSGADGAKTEHVFTQGVYAVVLTAEDENGQKASAQMNISVEVDCGC